MTKIQLVVIKTGEVLKTEFTELDMIKSIFKIRGHYLHDMVVTVQGQTLCTAREFLLGE